MRLTCPHCRRTALSNGRTNGVCAASRIRVESPLRCLSGAAHRQIAQTVIAAPWTFCRIDRMAPVWATFFHKEDRTETHDLRISLERPVWRPRNCPYGGHSADPTRMEKYRESAKPAARPPKPPASTRNEGRFADIRRRHPSVQKLLVRLHVISRCNVAKTRIGDGLGEVSRAPVHGTRL